MASRKRNDQLAIDLSQSLRQHDQAAIRSAGKFANTALNLTDASDGAGLSLRLLAAFDVQRMMDAPPKRGNAVPTGRNWGGADRFGGQCKAFSRCLPKGTSRARGKETPWPTWPWPGPVPQARPRAGSWGTPVNNGGAMALSDAERQRHYIARLRAAGLALTSNSWSPQGREPRCPRRWIRCSRRWR